MPFHTTDDGCRLAYELTGPETTPALVLCNSLGTDRSLWDGQIGGLATRFRVLAYDARGHGASDAPAGDYTIGRLGRDVLSLMDHVAIDVAHVCGVSIGGLTALWLGVHAPTRVRRLVLANTAACIGTRDLWTERMRVVQSQGLAAVADGSMGRWLTPAFRQTEPTTVARLTDTLLRMSVTGYVGGCAALRDADLRDVAPLVRAATMVVTGNHDAATAPAAGEWLAATIPGATLLVLEAAHLSNVERPAEFTAALLAFLGAN